jgi:hypothetical protein
MLGRGACNISSLLSVNFCSSQVEKKGELRNGKTNLPYLSAPRGIWVVQDGKYNLHPDP